MLELTLTNEGLNRIEKNLNLRAKDFKNYKELQKTNIELLQRLSLEGYQVTDYSLSEVAKMENLQELDLQDCDLITDEGIKKISPLKICESLTSMAARRLLEQALKRY